MSDALSLWSHARINPRGIDIDAYISHIILVPLNFGMYSFRNMPSLEQAIPFAI